MLLPVNTGIISNRFCSSIAKNFIQSRFFSIIKMSSASQWKEEKERILALPTEEKRKLYKSGDYITIDKVDPWIFYVQDNQSLQDKKHTVEDLNEFRKIKLNSERNININHKVSIFKGDITKLEVTQMCIIGDKPPKMFTF